MTPSKTTAVALVLLSLSATGYADDDQSSARTTFTELYGKLKVAMTSRDTEAVAAMLAPGFQSEDVSGKMQTAEQMVAGLTKLPQDPNKKSQTTVVSVALDGASAKVVQRYQMTTTKVNANGQVQSIELVAVSNDTWNRAGNAWKLFRTVTRQMDYSADGQAIIHKTHAPN